jgi:hypothetical protein
MSEADFKRLNPEQVRDWIASTEAEVAKLDVEANRVQTGLAEARKRLMLYHELLAALTKVPVRVSDEELRIGRSVRERTIQAAVEILREYHRPMPIQELHAAFIRFGKPLPGRGTPTNIVAHLGTSPVFVRRGRGIYALAEWESGVENGSPGQAGDQSDHERQHAAK